MLEVLSPVLGIMSRVRTQMDSVSWRTLSTTVQRNRCPKQMDIPLPQTTHTTSCPPQHDFLKFTHTSNTLAGQLPHDLFVASAMLKVCHRTAGNHGAQWIRGAPDPKTPKYTNKSKNENSRSTAPAGNMFKIQIKGIIWG